MAQIQSKAILPEPIAFFEIQIGRDVIGFLDIVLKINEVPKTVANFLELCNGNVKYPGGTRDDSYHSYKNSTFHRISRSFCQGGDYVWGNGFGGRAPKGSFKNENYRYKHQERGRISMANKNPRKVNSQFFITFKKCAWLNGKHVVFGRVTTDTMYVLDRIEQVETDNEGNPKEKVVIVRCGQKFGDQRRFAENEYRRGE